MFRRTLFYYLLALISGLAANKNSWAKETAFELPTSLAQTHYHLHQSPSLKHDYHIYVQLPDGVNTDATEKYPTVYLLDGGISFPLLAAYNRLLTLAKDVPELIIVGISYGSFDHREGNKRGTDFTAPAEDVDYYGGAAEFQTMLGKELLPLIEQQYPSDPEKRILYGQSLGGQFAIYNALTQPDLFMGLIASNPALHRNLGFFLGSHTDPKSKATNPLLFVSLAENDDKRFKEPAQQWVEHWQKLETKPFIMKVHDLGEHNHFSAAPNAFRNGLRWIFENNP